MAHLGWKDSYLRQPGSVPWPARNPLAATAAAWGRGIHPTGPSSLSAISLSRVHPVDQAATLDGAAAEATADGIHGLIQGALTLTQAALEQVALDSGLACQPRHADPQQTDWQQ